MLSPQSFSFCRGRKGVALVITLAFILLITVCVVAYFTRTMNERQVSNGSANETKVQLFTQGAAETIIGDLRQEIVAGSVATAPSPSPASGTVYRTVSPLNAVPYRVVSSGSLANLVKASISGTAFYSGATYDTNDYPAPNRAALLATDTSVSLNGRSISLARWNKPLLLPATSATDYTPVASYGYTAPDWILVARNNSNPTTWSAAMETSASNGATVIGRYAYNIYNEGGLLDVNVAGYPSTSGTLFPAYKPALSYADLTQVGLTQAQVDQLVGWRNYASANASGTFPNISPPVSGAGYYDYVRANQNGFINVSGTAGMNNNQTDRVFTSRQQLIQFLLQGLGQGAPSMALVNSLQSLGTFSRDINQPSLVRFQSTNSAKTFDYNANVPKVLPNGDSGAQGGNAAYQADDQINPSFLTVRVSGSFTRSDGSAAVTGEPLVKSRFALNRLAWITYKGPSSTRLQSDKDMQALINDGIPWSYLQLGTAANIQNYFGLTWDTTNYRWQYNTHNGSGSGAGAIMQLGAIASSGTREPDFFELLKATINVGSIGKSLAPSSTFMPSDDGNQNIASQQPFNYNYYPETSVDFQVLQIGANMIDQFQPANYPVRIWFNDNSGNAAYSPRIIAGVENLPYLYNILSGVLVVDPPNPLPRQGNTDTPTPYQHPTGTGTPADAGYSGTDSITSSGVGALMEFPVIWNPHDPASPTNAALSLSPTQLRVVADTTTPDQTADYMVSGNYWSLFTYGASFDPRLPLNSAGSFSNFASNSSAGDPTKASSANNYWYVDATGFGGAHAHASQNPNNGHGNQEIDINITANGNNTAFCPEPVMLLRPGAAVQGKVTAANTTLSDMNGNKFTLGESPNSVMLSDSGVSGYLVKNLPSAGLPALPDYYSDFVGASGYAAANGAKEYPDAAGTPYIGFYLGCFPYTWSYYQPSLSSTLSLSAEQGGAYVARVDGAGSPTQPPAGCQTACYMTYRMQYMDPNTHLWTTYDTKYGKVINGRIQMYLNSDSPGLCGFLRPGCNGMWGYWASAVDPRSSRFGLLWQSTLYFSSIDPYADPTAAVNANGVQAGAGFLAGPPPAPEYEAENSDWTSLSTYAVGWLDEANGILYTNRPDADAGSNFASVWTANAGWPFSRAGTTGLSSGWMAWVASNANAYCGIAPGLLSQNNSDVFYDPLRFYGSGQGEQNVQNEQSDDTGGNDISSPNYFADPDGMVRRGMGAYVPTGTLSSPSYLANSGYQGIPSSDTTVGLPLARAFTWDKAINPVYPLSPNPTINVFTPGKAQATSQSQSRPYFLHRPFHSVAELGYVFSDTPWRNLDFFTAESGNTGLLDLFCINDETNTANGLIAGKIDLNSRQPKALQAVMAGAYLDAAQPGSSVITGSLGTIVSGSLAQALVARTSDFTNVPNGTGPLQNIGELVGRWVTNMAIVQLPVGSSPSGLDGATAHPPLGNSFYDGKLSYAGFSGGVWDNTSKDLSKTARKPFVNGVENFSSATGVPLATGTAEDVYSAYMNSGAFSSANAHDGSLETVEYVQRFREAPIRALAAAGQTRVWNLMIDVIAQTGRYPLSASGLADFQVEAEQRYWVHVAIDRCTGQVLDKQIEVVKE